MQGSGVQNASLNVDFLKHLDDLNYHNDTTVRSELRMGDIGGQAKQDRVEQPQQNVAKIHISQVKWAKDRQDGSGNAAGRAGPHTDAYPGASIGGLGARTGPNEYA